MKCPICGLDNNIVTESRGRKKTDAWYRRRKCLSCGKSFTTRERYCPDELDTVDRHRYWERYVR